MNKSLFLFLSLFWGMGLSAQTINFSEDIAPIIYEKCTSCHRAGEIGPMPFTNYSEVFNFALTIDAVTQSGYMPPWPPDAEYSNLVGERVLTVQEKQLIHDWVVNGAPQGDPSLEPNVPVFPSGSALGVPDLVLPMSEAYTIAGNNQDDYRVFVLPTGLTQDQEVAAIEFRAGNSKIVHHALMISESTGIGQTLDNQDPGYGYTSFGGFGVPNSLVDEFHGGWAPGLVPDFFPDGTGQILKANSNLLVQIHYAPYPTAEKDSSYVNVFFRQQPISREVENLEYAFVQLIIPPSQVKTVTRSFTVQSDKSLIGFLPHSHLIGSSWKLFFRNLQGDTVPVISIPEWDFNWQGMYKPTKMIKIPAGSIFFATCVYDNTASNPSNPNSPPLTMTWGEGTEDEMFYIILQLLDYQSGDENISLESSLGSKEFSLHKASFSLFPNPVADQLNMQFYLSSPQEVQWKCLDLMGRTVLEATLKGKLQRGLHTIEVDTKDLATGSYILSLEIEGQRLVKRFNKQTL